MNKQSPHCDESDILGPDAWWWQHQHLCDVSFSSLVPEKRWLIVTFWSFSSENSKNKICNRWYESWIKPYPKRIRLVSDLGLRLWKKKSKLCPHLPFVTRHFAATFLYHLITASCNSARNLCPQKNDLPQLVDVSRRKETLTVRLVGFSDPVMRAGWGCGGRGGLVCGPWCWNPIGTPY